MTDNSVPEFAFPGNWHPDMGWYPRYTPNGMAMLQYYAAKAMQGILSADTQNRFPSTDVARWAFEAARAMLEEEKNING